MGNSNIVKNSTPLYALNLSECAVTEFVDFTDAPYPASHHLQVVSSNLTLRLCCETEEIMQDWLIFLKKSSSTVASTDVASKSNRRQEDELVISISLNGDLLSCCPITAKVSAKLVLERRLTRRSSMEELKARNVFPASDKCEGEEFSRSHDHGAGASAWTFGTPISHGWLMKKGHFRRSWKKRFFVLSTSLEDSTEKVRFLFEARVNSAKFSKTKCSHLSLPISTARFASATLRRSFRS